MHHQESFVIVATYGNAWPDQRWASGIRSLDDAKILKQGAIDKGFDDAEIWREKNFQEMLREKERMRADSSGNDRRRR